MGNYKRQNDMQIEFLQALHDEKIKSQTERATYVTSKFAFITGLFGVGVLHVGDFNFSMLLYFIPPLTICYDLYIRAADLSVKKMGSFLRNDPLANVTSAEKAWEKFSVENRDNWAQNATVLVSFIIIVAAAVLTFVQHSGSMNVNFLIGNVLWYLGFMIVCFLLWLSQRNAIEDMDKKGPVIEEDSARNNLSCMRRKISLLRCKHKEKQND